MPDMCVGDAKKDKNGGCLSYLTVLEYPSVKNKCPHYRYESEERTIYGRNDQVFCGEAESNPRSTVKGSGSKAASGVREGSDHTGSG